VTGPVAREMTDAELEAVVLEHVGDHLGHCARCGEEWICPARLRAARELRRRGRQRPILEAP